jgi:hypothetical protein
MPSIFIWKSNEPNKSKKNIKIYQGSNWILEENEYSSKSYMYIEQIVISELDNSVITYNIKNMPQDWTGSDLLEVNTIPYELIKSDKYGTLERIGIWMRFIKNDDICFNIDTIKKEFDIIKRLTTGNYIENPKIDSDNIFDTKHIQMNFNTFFNNYKLPEELHRIYNKKMYNTHKYNTTKKINTLKNDAKIKI